MPKPFPEEKRQEWKRLVEQWEASDQKISIARWCAQQNINYNNFYEFSTSKSLFREAQQLRVRYLGELELTDLLADLPAKPVVEPEEPWLADRKKQLDKPVTFKFEDTSVEEVVALLSQLTGVKIGLVQG